VSNGSLLEKGTDVGVWYWNRYRERDVRQ